MIPTNEQIAYQAMKNCNAWGEFMMRFVATEAARLAREECAKLTDAWLESLKPDALNMSDGVFGVLTEFVPKLSAAIRAGGNPHVD